MVTVIAVVPELLVFTSLTLLKGLLFLVTENIEVTLCCQLLVFLVGSSRIQSLGIPSYIVCIAGHCLGLSRVGVSLQCFDPRVDKQMSSVLLIVVDE